jgi:cytochrome P450
MSIQFVEDNSGDIQRLASITTSAATSAEDLTATAQQLYGLLDTQINAQYESPRDGVISKLIEESRKGQIEHRQILGLSFEAIVAGHETTGNTISMGMLQLFASPEIRARVVADPSLIPGMVVDMIRCIPWWTALCPVSRRRILSSAGNKSRPTTEWSSTSVPPATIPRPMAGRCTQ